MKEHLYMFMENKKKSSVLRYIVFVIIFLMIIDQVFSLTYFVYNYSINYDYGKQMEKTCESNYVEYETDRFQVSNNIVDISIKNDNYNGQYDSFVLILSTVVSFFMIYFFVFIFIENIFDNYLSTILNKVFITGQSNQTVTSTMQELFGLFTEMSIIKQIIIILKVLLVLSLFIIVPLTFILKFKYNIDISPFFPCKSNNFGDMFQNYDVIIAIFYLLILVVLLFKSNISIFFNIVFLYIFFVSFYFILYVYDAYSKHSEVVRESSKYNNADNDLLKQLQFSLTYFDDINNTNTNIMYQFLERLFGFETFNLCLKSTKDIIAYLISIIMILLIIYGLLRLKPNGMSLYGMFDKDSLDSDSVYYFALVPNILLFVVLTMNMANKEFNTFINKYILYKPNNLYKRNIQKINQIFNEIIVNDKTNIQNNSVCKNVANAVNMTLYSNLFHLYEGDIFTPRFIYSSSCEKGDYIEYFELKEYEFDNYINTKGINIFYDDGKCSSVNNDLIISVMRSVIPYYKGKKLEETDLISFKASFVHELKYAMMNVMNKKTYCGTRALVLSNDFNANNTIKKINVPQNDAYTFDEDTLAVVMDVADEYTKYIEIVHNYVFTVIQALCRCNDIEDFTSHGYDNLYEKIEDTVRNSTNGNYSLNIKKEFVNKFTLITKQMFKNVNTVLSKRTKKTEDNNKVTKYIIQNYNAYQMSSHRKYLQDNFIELNTNDESNVPFQFEDIEDIRDVISSLNDLIHILFRNTGTEIDKEINQTKLNDKVKLLTNMKNNYIDLYKSKYYYDSNIYNEMLYDYKLDYIEQHIEIHSKMITKFKSSSKYDIQNVITVDVYDDTFNSISKNFDNKYIVVKKLANDQYKKEVEATNYRDIETDMETYSRNLLTMANNSSTNVYTLISLYVVVILIANFIQ